MEPIEQVRQLLMTERLAVLATQGDQGPYASLVSVTASADLRRVVFPTLRASTKYHNLARYPAVALMLDTRSSTDRDLTEAIALTVLGSAREAEREERGDLQATFLTRHPDLSSFVSDSDCALIVVQVNRYVLVSEFDHKDVLDIA